MMVALLKAVIEGPALPLLEVAIEGLLALLQRPVLDPRLPREPDIAMAALLEAASEGFVLLQRPVLEAQVQPTEPVHPLVARPEMRFLPSRHTTGAPVLLETTSQQHPNLKSDLRWRPQVEWRSERA
jgi:hypothetical protein